jgi:hypothetical protein
MSQKETYTLRHSWDETTKSSLVHTLICLKRYSYMIVSNGNETATVIYDETILLSVELSNKIPYAILDNFCFCQHFATTFGSQKKKKKKKKKDRKHSMIVSNGGTHVDYYVCNHSIRTFFSTFFFLQIGKLTL